MSPASWRTLPIKAKAPPVPKRPRCPQCGKPLSPVYRSQDDEGVRHWSPEDTHRAWTGEYDSYGYFCTMRCAVSFANNAVRVLRGDT